MSRFREMVKNILKEADADTFKPGDIVALKYSQPLKVGIVQ